MNWIPVFITKGLWGCVGIQGCLSTTRELKDTSQPLPSCSRLQSFRSDAHHKIYSNSPWTHKSSIKNQMFFLCSIYKSINVWVDQVSCLTLISGFWRVRGPGHPAGSCPEWGGRCCRWISAPIPELSSAADGSVEDTLPPQWTWSTIKALANNYTNNISVPQTAPKQTKGQYELISSSLRLRRL